MNPTVSKEFPAVALSEEDRASYEALRLTEEEAKSLEAKIIDGNISEGKITSFDDVHSLPVEREIIIEDCPEIPVKPV